MKIKLGGLLVLLMSILVLSGCTGYDDQPATVAAKSGGGAPQPLTTPPAATPAAATPSSATPPPAAKSPTTVPEKAKVPPAVTEKAKGGMGAGSQAVGKPGGILTTPISAYFYITERLAFDMVTHALDLFRGAEGRWPKDEAEFNQRIIKENQIRLPTLPEGHTYFYDPEKGQLMIRHPAPPQ
jgi:hypothetical protein